MTGGLGGAFNGVTTTETQTEIGRRAGAAEFVGLPGDDSCSTCLERGNSQLVGCDGDTAKASRSGVCHPSSPPETKAPTEDRLGLVDTATYRKVATAVSEIDIDAFYANALHELGLLAHRGGSAVGAAAVLKRVALAYGVPAAERIPLPRLTRLELAEFGRVGVSRERARLAVPRGR